MALTSAAFTPLYSVTLNAVVSCATFEVGSYTLIKLIVFTKSELNVSGHLFCFVLF